jgi:uncharacterized protein DUF3307
MSCKTLALLILAHFLGDMVFTSHGLAVLKRDSALKKQLLAVSLHCAIHGVCAGLLLFMGGRGWVAGALMVFAFHFFIDLTRTSVEKAIFGPNRLHVGRSEFFSWIMGKPVNRDKMNVRGLLPWFSINLADQGAHLASLVFISFLC